MNRLLLALLVASLAAVGVMAQGTAPAGAKPAATLENTTWKLINVGDIPAIVMPPVREASFMLHPADHRLSGSGGCNRLLGRYELSADTVKFAPTGTTMMACPEELMQQESDFVSALKMTTSYRISGDTLELRNGERVLARFMAQTKGSL